MLFQVGTPQLICMYFLAVGHLGYIQVLSILNDAAFFCGEDIFLWIQDFLFGVNVQRSNHPHLGYSFHHHQCVTVTVSLSYFQNWAIM